MSADGPDGGSAFPQVDTFSQGERGNYREEVRSYGGMSLRDYFAVKAPDPPRSWYEEWSETLQPLVGAAHARAAARIQAAWSYVYADAMLGARK